MYPSCQYEQITAPSLRKSAGSYMCLRLSMIDTTKSIQTWIWYSMWIQTTFFVFGNWMCLDRNFLKVKKLWSSATRGGQLFGIDSEPIWSHTKTILKLCIVLHTPKFFFTALACRTCIITSLLTNPKNIIGYPFASLGRMFGFSKTRPEENLVQERVSFHDAINLPQPEFSYFLPR